jgi:hypothetical protein
MEATQGLPQSHRGHRGQCDRSGGPVAGDIVSIHAPVWGATTRQGASKPPPADRDLPRHAGYATCDEAEGPARSSRNAGSSAAKASPAMSFATVGWPTTAIRRIPGPRHRYGTVDPQLIEPHSGLRGVPLLLFVSPQNQIAYLGGYGAAGDQDETIFHQLRAGLKPVALPMIGCAVGSRLQRRLDPLHLKY